MEWDAIGAIGEILGALAVVGTLIHWRSRFAQRSKSRGYFSAVMPAAKPATHVFVDCAREVVTVTRSDFLCLEKHI